MDIHLSMSRPNSLTKSFLSRIVLLLAILLTWHIFLLPSAKFSAIHLFAFSLRPSSHGQK